MKRQIKIITLSRDPFTNAYIKERLKDDPTFFFCETPSPDVDAFIVERPLLTPSEQEVLQALANLGTIEDVSKQLNYHPSTVKRKLSRVYEKLKVKSAPQAVAVAMRLGLIK
ncbi:MAG: helix-turn-helix transcriptional regulator [Aquificaceae bacterium]|nr:helix-turn-helix transcriptional regulator [Aquificaceae bacterium]MDW8029706.1 helix-turn-helix transcriptional regulator [Armatimonadota bacterium]